MPVLMLGNATLVRPFSAASSSDRPPVAARQQVRFALRPAPPHRPHRVNDVTGGQPVAFGEFGVAGFTAVQRPAFGQQFGSGGPVDGPVDAPAPQQTRVGRVHDGVDGLLGNVALNDLNQRFTNLTVRFLSPATSVITYIPADRPKLGRAKAAMPPAS